MKDKDEDDVFEEQSAQAISHEQRGKKKQHFHSPSCQGACFQLSFQTSLLARASAWRCLVAIGGSEQCTTCTYTDSTLAMTNR